MDSNNDLWRLEQRTDDIGETLPGQTVPESLIDSQDYLVCYTY
jgi:hypothetical protein